MYASPRERTASALAAMAVVVLTGWALILGLGAGVVAQGRQALVSVFAAPEPPPVDKPPPRKPASSPRPAAKGDPSPRNLRNQATQVVAPVPFIPLAPPTIPTAVRAGIGDAASNGASDLPGPGQGAGGIGDGLGGGGDGGDGDGGGGAAFGPRQVRGKLSYRDLPQDTLSPGTEARVGVRYWVETDGRVRGCRVDEPSAYPAIDAMTCRMIEQRFVYRPARNRAGRPVRAPVVEWHTWFSREEGD